MEPQRRFSKTFAFLLLAGVIVVAIGAVGNTIRVNAFDPQHHSLDVAFGIKQERSAQQNAAAQNADIPAPPGGRGHSLYRSATRYSVAVQPVSEDLAAVLRREKEQTPLRRSVMLPSQRFGDEKEDSISPFAQPDFSGLVSPSRNVRSNTSQSKRVAPSTLMTPSPSPDRQFDTNPDSGLNRPDSAIAAGPSDLVTAVNFAFQVQDLNGANVASTGLNSFFPSDPTHSVGDPRLSYDQATGRFIMSVLGFDYPGQTGPSDPGDSWCDVAVSATSDPRGVWNKYTFHVLRGTEQMDFDSLGYDGKAIYVTARMRDFANNTQFSGNRMLILDKAKALAGQALSPIVVDDLQLPGGGLAEIIKPVEPGEPVTPTSPAYFLCTQGNDKVALYTLTDPLGATTFSSVQISIPAWADAGQAPQPGSPPLLGQEAGFPLHKTIIRNGVVWSCQSPSATGVAGDRAGVVVYKFDPVAGTLLESHAISDPSVWFYLPAVVPDVSGNAVVVFAGSDATHFASIYHARYVAAMGDFEAPVVTAAGTTSFNAGPAQQPEEAWGDYLDAALDVASGSVEVWVHGELPATATTWKMHAARIPSTVCSTITCPANVTQSNDPNQCGAIVNYPAPTVNGPCTASCSPSSGSFFPIGTTTVTCTEESASCMFTVTVNDTQTPTITCPSDITATAAVACPLSGSSGPVNFTVTASDNCPGVTVVCKNQNNQVVTSGQTFPVGSTTVTCTATDASGNTATCSFTVTVFSFCLQDETNPGNVVLINAQTGDYVFCCGGVLIASGRGDLTSRGCIGSIDNIKGDRQVHIQWDTSAKNNAGAGTAIVQKRSNKIVCQITDKNMTNNSCACQ